MFVRACASALTREEDDAAANAAASEILDDLMRAAGNTLNKRQA